MEYFWTTVNFNITFYNLVEFRVSQIFKKYSIFQVEKDKVIINLHKVKSVPWAGDLSRNGLETAKEEEEEEEGKE